MAKGTISNSLRMPSTPLTKATKSQNKSVFTVVNDLVRLKVAPLHPLLRRSAALAYTRRWWSILAMGAQSAAIDCILGRDPQVWVPHGEPPLATVLADADIAPEPSRLF